MSKIKKFRNFIKEKKKIFHDFYTGSHKKDKWIPDEYNAPPKTEIKEEVAEKPKHDDFGKLHAALKFHMQSDNIDSMIHVNSSARHLNNHYKNLDQRPHYTDLHNYTQSHYSEAVNRYLWVDHHDENNQYGLSHHHIDTTIKGLDHIMNQWRTPHDIVLYHGLNRSPEHHSPNHNGLIGLHMKAYTSTSLDPKIASGFTKGDPASKHNYWEVGKSGMIESRHPMHPEMAHLLRQRLAGEITGEGLDKYWKHYNEHQNKYGEGNPEIYRHVIQMHVPQGSRGVFIGVHSKFPNEHEFLLPRSSKVEVHPKPTLDYKEKVVYWHAKLVHDGTEPTRHAQED